MTQQLYFPILDMPDTYFIGRLFYNHKKTDI